ncbi:MAG: efflux RND transporter periplasmic adaptor subunit [Alphaproteobacteria bacterium]|nr:efflux RND transporter periplasmic adaptor subunit [Alphaproteobacteria bacterium]
MKKSALFALLISVLAVLWVLSGLNGSAPPQENAPSSEQGELTQEDLVEVQVQNLSATEMTDSFTVTGRTRASRSVQIKSETSGQIASLLVEKGARVKKGQILAKLKIDERGSTVLEAEKLLSQRQIQYQAATELAERGFNSRVRLAEAKAELETAKSALKKARVELANINIKAPFEGILNMQHIEIGDYVTAGANIFDLVDLDPIEIVGFVTEKQLPYIKEGEDITARLLKDQTIQGKISFIAAASDPQTRTFEMEAIAPNTEHKIKEGLTAQISIPIREETAYRLPTSILTLADDGAIGVKLVDENNKVKFRPVRILKDTPSYIWVGGLPPAIKVITVGQEFVIHGQEVKAVAVP